MLAVPFSEIVIYLLFLGSPSISLLFFYTPLKVLYKIFEDEMVGRRYILGMCREVERGKYQEEHGPGGQEALVLILHQSVCTAKVPLSKSLNLG